MLILRPRHITVYGINVRMYTSAFENSIPTAISCDDAGIYAQYCADSIKLYGRVNANRNPIGIVFEAPHLPHTDIFTQFANI